MANLQLKQQTNMAHAAFVHINVITTVEFV